MSDLRWVDKSPRQAQGRMPWKTYPKNVCVLFCDVIQCLFSHLPRFRALYRSMQWKFFKILKFLISLYCALKNFLVLEIVGSALARIISLNMLYEQKNLNKNFHKGEELENIFSNLNTQTGEVLFSFSFCVSPSQCLSRELESFFGKIFGKKFLTRSICVLYKVFFTMVKVLILFFLLLNGKADWGCCRTRDRDSVDIKSHRERSGSFIFNQMTITMSWYCIFRGREWTSPNHIKIQHRLGAHYSSSSWLMLAVLCVRLCIIKNCMEFLILCFLCHSSFVACMAEGRVKLVEKRDKNF